MLSERFLRRLEDAFPHFYDRVNADAMEDARRILQETNGDVDAALARARMQCAGRLWWPYAKGIVGRDLDAMEAFARLVLTVDHVLGHAPPTMDAAREQVVRVLRHSLDVERLRALLAARPAAKQAAGAGAGLFASVAAFLGPLATLNKARKWARFVPTPLLVALGAVVAAAVLSIPIVAGYSAGHQAERVARGADKVPPVDTRGRPVAA
jgi:hypothetical protein